MPAELDDEGIHAIVAMFAPSAERACRAGFDLIEIHGAHGYLVHNFFSPITNRRMDQWGGSLESRMRFPVATARAVRRVWLTNRALGFRIYRTDWRPDDLPLDDAVLLAKTLKEVGVDYVAMSAGNIAPGIAIPPASPGH